MRIAFLFNHYAAHQVLQCAPIAFALSQLRPDLEVIIAYTCEEERQMVMRIAGLYREHRCKFLLLRPAWWYRFLDPIVSKRKFEKKKRVLRDNLEFFRHVDVVVTPERHSLRLKSELGLKHLLLIHARHGAGDRSVPSDPRMAEFDFVLLPGPKYEQRFLEAGLIRPGRYSVIGWPKFDVVQALTAKKPPIFANDNPVVVYNPHFDPRTSSYGTMGPSVLDYFAATPRYNLIFAPHTLLFKRRWRHGVSLPKRYRHVPNIFMDTGSMASNDMTYMLAANIYLGDTSSQVYEFLLTPRPCIFLNAHGVDWKHDPHYAHWHLGDVVSTIPELDTALRRAVASGNTYADRQRQAFAYTFHREPGRSAAEVGAEAIASFLDQRPMRAHQERATVTRGIASTSSRP